MDSVGNDFWNNINKTARKLEQKYAAVYCDENQILMRVTYHDVLEVNRMLDQELARLSDVNCTCFGLLMEHNPYIPAILMSIWKVNSAFMFLDVHNPEVDEQARKLSIKYMLIITDNAEEFKLNNVTHLASLAVSKTSLLHLASFDERINHQSFKNINFMIQTSGTTGRRKLIKVQHECIISNVNCLRKIFELNENDVLYFGTNLMFDPSVIELYLAMSTGACLLMVSQKTRRNPSALLRALSSNRVSFLQMCPSSFLRWSKDEMQRVFLHDSLKVLVLGGEAFPVSVLQLPRSNTLRIYNIYGVTEVSCWASIYNVKGNESEVPLGLPLDDTILEVRDENGCIIKDGTGEIFIGSCKRFCQVGEESEHNTKAPLFRATGDRVLIKDNRLYYQCRSDDVIKRCGCRVDLSSIETSVFNETHLESKCVWLTEKSKLVLFVKISETDALLVRKIIDKLRVKLLHCLTKEAFPDQIEALTMFPVTRNGKVNKSTLETWALDALESRGNNVDLLQTFVSLWSKCFGLGRSELIDYKDCGFYELGGNSFLSVQFSAELKDITGADYSNDFFDFMFSNSYDDVCKFIAAGKQFNNNKRKFEQMVDDVSSESRDKCTTMEVMWKYNLHACVDSTATVSQNNLVAIGAFSHIFAVVNLEDGSEVLRLVLPDAIENECSMSPCNNFVYVGCCDGAMYCINVPDGQIIWRYSTGNKIKNKPCLISGNTLIVFGSYDKYLHCVNVQNGDKVWKSCMGESITSNPIFMENIGRIFVATIQGSCHCINESNGDILWTTKFNCPVFGSPCLFDSSVAWPGVQGFIRGIACETGNELWEFQAQGQVYSSLIAYDKFIVFGCQDKNVYCIEPSGRTVTIAFKVMLDSVISAGCSVVKCNNYEYIAASTVAGGLYIINIKDACIASKILLNGHVFSTPIVVQNKILVGCRDDHLYCVVVKTDEHRENNILRKSNTISC